MVVHLGSEIECSFGIIDAEGNVRVPKTFTFTLESLSDVALLQLRALIEQRKTEYLDSVVGPPTAEEAGSPAIPVPATEGLDAAEELPSTVG